MKILSTIINLSLAICLILSYLYIIELKEQIASFSKPQSESIINLEESTVSHKDLVTGGFEISPDPAPTTFNTVFPIHSEDFKQFTSAFGLRVSPFLKKEMKHNGLDIQTVWNAQVIAIDDGTVIDHYPAPGTPYPGGGRFRGHPVYGGMVKIQHAGYTSLYAHLAWTRVKIGQKIKAGEIIGRVGSTGKSTGQHLHLEIMINDQLVNPLLYIPEP